MEQGYDQEQTGVADEPMPIGTVTEDYFLPFTVPPGLMPDRQFDGRPARLQVHRVQPVYGLGDRPTVRRAVVLIHGRTVPGPVVFDLQDPATGGVVLNLSVQRALALKGIDTFAPSLLGYGGSTRFDEGLKDPGNASRRGYPTTSPDSPCEFPEGCDRNNPLATINPLNQQAKLLPAGGPAGRPLFFRRAHSSNFHFARTDVWVRDIDQVIDDAIERAQPTDRKVALVGYSLGGQHVGRTLYADNPNELLDDRDKVIAKVSRVVFLNSLFFPLGPTEEPDPLGLPTFPLTLDDRAASNELWKPFNAADDSTLCTGRVIPNTQQQVWDQTMENDTAGQTWGPPPAWQRGNSGGLNRSPTFSGYGWNSAVAGQLRKPTLVMQGLQDGALPLAPGTTPEQHAKAIYDALPAPPVENVFNKVLVKVKCASHVLQWEGCTGEHCTPHYETFQNALIEWITKGTFDGDENGTFTVDEEGDVSKP